MFQTFLSQLDLTEIVLAIFLSISGAAAVWYRRRFPVWKKFWVNALDGLASVPGLVDDVKGIRYYVGPNGGGSLMDGMRRTEASVATLAEQFDLMLQTMRAENDTDEDIGRFHCNQEGENTYVNQLYARWLGVGKAELLGWNYLNFVHPNDINRVRQHWEQCRDEHRQYRIRHAMVSSMGVTINVEVIATPIPEKSPAKRWIGAIRRIETP